MDIHTVLQEALESWEQLSVEMDGLQVTPACPPTLTIWALGGAFHTALLHTELYDV